MEIGYLIFYKHHKLAENFKTKYEFYIKTVHDIHSLCEKKKSEQRRWKDLLPPHHLMG